MNDADAYALALAALRWIRKHALEAEDDEDADPWLVIESMEARATDTLAAVGDEPV